PTLVLLIVWSTTRISIASFATRKHSIWSIQFTICSFEAELAKYR
ncbi:28469_t:CDS:1, partial [Racocetra persica]